MPKATLTPDQLDRFQAELDALRAEVAADLGERDATHIRSGGARRAPERRRRPRTADVRLRSGQLRRSAWSRWRAAKILENMEVGHNVLHGQYDWMGDPTLNSQNYEWDIVCHSSHWRRTHNFEHHSYTNILGQDDDYGYGLLRMTGEPEMDLAHAAAAALVRAAGDLVPVGRGDPGSQARPLVQGTHAQGRTRASARRRSSSKARSQLYKDYVLFPLLAFWNIPRVLLGNALANLIRSLWTNAIIFCGHFTADAQVFTKAEVAGETRGGWYLRQIQGSSNLEGGRWFHLLTGHLSHQIEHHLYPGHPGAALRRDGTARARDLRALWRALQLGGVLEPVRNSAVAHRQIRAAGGATAAAELAADGVKRPAVDQRVAALSQTGAAMPSSV